MQVGYKDINKKPVLQHFPATFRWDSDSAASFIDHMNEPPLKLKLQELQFRCVNDLFTVDQCVSFLNDIYQDVARELLGESCKSTACSGLLFALFILCSSLLFPLL